MGHTVVGVFDSNQEAQAAKQELLACGVPGNQLHIESGSAADAMKRDDRTAEDREPGFFERLLRFFEGSDDHSGEYAEAVRRGSCVVVAEGIDESQLDRVADTMSRLGAIDIDKRVSSWREQGWTGYDANASRRSEADMSTGLDTPGSAMSTGLDTPGAAMGTGLDTRDAGMSTGRDTRDAAMDTGRDARDAAMSTGLDTPGAATSTGFEASGAGMTGDGTGGGTSGTGGGTRGGIGGGMTGERNAGARDTAMANDQDTTRIPVVEEQLEVGKRVVNRGGVRVYARTTERPVEEQVTLREERTLVERRPVNRPATEADLDQAFKEGTVELRETVEEPVVRKSARVVEEVELAKEINERTETIRDTVRRTDVNVDDMSQNQSRADTSSVQRSAGGASMSRTEDMAQNALMGDTSSSRRTAQGASMSGAEDMSQNELTGGTSSSQRTGQGASMSAGGASDAMDPDDLNKLLRDELSAIETYRQALEKNRKEYGHDARFEQLAQMLRDHEEAASRLRGMIRQMGGTESNDSGAWGTWATTVMGTAKIFGESAALKALKEGEESGVKDYESVLQDHTPPPEVQNVFQSILSKEQEHVRQLDRLMETV